MKISTSTRISLWFAGMTIVILGVFAVVVLHIFSRGWKRVEATRLQIPHKIEKKIEGVTQRL